MACAFACQPLERHLTRRVQIEEPLTIRPTNRVELDAVRCEVVDVADRSHGWPVALLGFLAQTLLDLLAQVVHVVLRHQDLDAVHELLGGT